MRSQVQPGNEDGKRRGGLMKVLLHFLLILLFTGLALSANIEGEVSDSLSGESIAGAKISALGFSDETADSSIFTAVSNENGKFLFENLPAGKYYLMCQHPDFKKVSLPWLELNEGDTEYIHFILEPYTGPMEPRIKGYVYSTPQLLPAIIPLEDAVVYLKGRQIERKTSTGPDGSYQFGDLLPGKYLIWAEARDHHPMDSPDTIEILDNSRVLNHNFFLIPEDQVPPVYLVGAVYDATANTPNYPVYPATITLTFNNPLIYGPIDTMSITVTNNPDGSFGFRNLIPAIYDVRCAAKGYYTEYIKGLDLRNGPDKVFFYMKKQVEPPENYVSGQVLNGEDNSPIQSATVSLAGLGPFDIAYVSYTDARGFYHFKSVLPGKYEIRAVARGFYPSRVDTIAIREDTIIKDHDIYLKPLEPSNLVTMHGYVYNGLSSSIKPVHPAYISLIGYNEIGDSLVYHTRNNPDGSYKIANIVPGRYTVRCSAPDFQPQVIRDFPMRPPVVEKNFFLLPRVYPEKGWITGTVKFDKTDIPVVGAKLYFMSKNEVYYRAVTGNDGRYKAFLPADKYYISCVYQKPDSSYYYQEYYDDVHSLADATPVAVYPQEVTSGIDFGIPYPVPPNSVIISGIVTDHAGHPLKEALVRAVQINPPFYFRDNLDVYQTWTDEHGRYKIKINLDRYCFANIAYGFIVSAEKPGYKLEFYDEKPAPYLADILWTTHGTIFNDINFTLDPVNLPNSISGTILSNTGNPIAHTFVIAANANTGEIFFAFADRSGGYTLHSLPAGYYYILFLAPGHIPEYYDDAMTWEDATPVLAHGTVTGIDAELSHFMWQLRDGTLAGVIHDQNGDPLQGALVCIRNMNREMINYGLTDQAGSYSVIGLENGLYQVTVSKVNYASATEWVEFDSTVSDLSMLNFSLDPALTDLPGSDQNTSRIPNTIELQPNYPNPFNPETKINFGIPESQHVKLAVYDILGRKISELLNSTLPAGTYDVTWNGTSDSGQKVSSGIYFYVLVTEKQQLVRKMILNK